MTDRSTGRKTITPEALEQRREDLGKKLHYLENDPNYAELRRTLEIDTRLNWLDARLGELRQNKETRLEHLSSIVEALDKLEAAIETEEFKQKYAVSEKILEHLRTHPEVKLEELKPADFTSDPNLQKPDVWANIVTDARGGSQVKSLLENPAFNPKDPKSWTDTAGNKLQEAGSWIADGVKKHPEILAAVALAVTAGLLWKFGKKVWGTLAGAAAIGLGFVAWKKDLVESLGEKAKDIVEKKADDLFGSETVKDAKKTAEDLLEKAKKEKDKLKAGAQEFLTSKEEVSAYDQETAQRAEVVSERCSPLDAYIYKMLRKHKAKPAYSKFPVGDLDMYLARLEADPPQGLTAHEKMWLITTTGFLDKSVEIATNAAGAIVTLGGTLIWKIAKKDFELIMESLEFVGKGFRAEDGAEMFYKYTEGAIFVGGVTTVLEYFSMASSGKLLDGTNLPSHAPRGFTAIKRGISYGWQWPVKIISLPGHLLYRGAEKMKKIKLLGLVNLEKNRFLVFMSETGEKIGRFDLSTGARQLWQGGKWATGTTPEARYKRAVEGENLESAQKTRLTEKAIGEKAKALRKANPTLTEEAARTQALEELETARAEKTARNLAKGKKGADKGAEKVSSVVKQSEKDFLQALDDKRLTPAESALKIDRAIAQRAANIEKLEGLGAKAARTKAAQELQEIALKAGKWEKIKALGKWLGPIAIAAFGVLQAIDAVSETNSEIAKLKWDGFFLNTGSAVAETVAIGAATKLAPAIIGGGATTFGLAATAAATPWLYMANSGLDSAKESKMKIEDWLQSTGGKADRILHEIIVTTDELSTGDTYRVAFTSAEREGVSAEKIETREKLWKTLLKAEDISEKEQNIRLAYIKKHLPSLQIADLAEGKKLLLSSKIYFENYNIYQGTEDLAEASTNKQIQELEAELRLKKVPMDSSALAYALYEAAKVLGYDGNGTLEELKKFFAESDRDVRGIYWNGEQWMLYEEGLEFDDEMGAGEEATQNIIKRLRENAGNVFASRNKSILDWATGKQEAADVNLRTRALTMAGAMEIGLNKYKKEQQTEKEAA